MRHHTRAFAAVAAAMLLAVGATACSDGTDQNSSGAGTVSPSSGGTYTPAEVAQADSATVSTKSGSLGKILVNNKGRTLYLFQADKTSKSTCTGGCAEAWPPLVVKGKPTGSGGVQSKKLSTSKRDDGTTQVTYNGHPLYRFGGDQKAGDMNGQGLNNFGAKWYVLGTNGKQITASSSQPGGGGY